MSTTTAPLAPLVDALVGEPLTGLSITELQERIAAVAPQVGRLHGWLLTAQAALAVAGDGQVPTDDGRGRSVAGWLADVRSETASTCGREVRTVSALRTWLPQVVDAVLRGVLTSAQAAVLARLIGKIDDASWRRARRT